MDRSAWLLLLIARSSRPRGLDPVRLQKGMFLLAREAGLDPRERYDFRPYNYGPMSLAVYHDLDRHVAAGLVRRLPIVGHRWRTAIATSSGRVHAQRLADELRRDQPLALRRLGHIVQMLDSLDFAALLETVSARYPEYTTRSVFRP